MLSAALIAAIAPAPAAAAPVEVAHEIEVDFGAHAGTLSVRRSVRSDGPDTHEGRDAVVPRVVTLER